MLKPSSMKKLLVITLLGVMVSFGQSPAFSADSPLDVIPDNVTFVVRLKAPKTVVEKAAKIADAVRPGTGQLIIGQSQSLGMAIANPGLDGVNQEGEFWVAAFVTDAKKEPDVVLIIPGTDVDEMKDAIDASYDFMAYKSWGIYTQDKDVLQNFRDCLSGSKKALKTIPAGKSATVFNTGDLNIWVNLLEIKKIYKTQIMEGRQQAEEGLKKLGQTFEDAQGQGLPGTEGVNMAEILKFYAQALKFAFQALDDSEMYTFSVGIERAGGINVNEYFQTAKDSKTAKSFQALSPSASTILGKLPSKDMIYIEASSGIMQLQTQLLDFASNMMKVPEEKKEDLKKTFDGMKKLKFGNHGFSVTFGDIAEGMLRATVIGKLDPISLFKESVRKMVRITGNMEVQGMTQTSEIKTDAETYGTEKADVTTVTQTFDDSNPVAAYQQQFIQALYGPNGLTSRTIYKSDRYIQTTGGGKERMEASLKSATSGKTSRNAALVRDRKALPEKTDLIILTDLSTIVTTVVTKLIESGTLPVPFDPSPLAELELKKSYLGWSITSSDQGMHMRTNVPLIQIQNIGKLVEAFIQMQQNPQF